MWNLVWSAMYFPISFYINVYLSQKSVRTTHQRNHGRRRKQPVGEKTVHKAHHTTVSWSSTFMLLVAFWDLCFVCWFGYYPVTRTGREGELGESYWDIWPSDLTHDLRFTQHNEHRWRLSDRVKHPGCAAKPSTTDASKHTIACFACSPCLVWNQGLAIPIHWLPKIC